MGIGGRRLRQGAAMVGGCTGDEGRRHGGRGGEEGEQRCRTPAVEMRGSTGAEQICGTTVR